MELLYVFIGIVVGYFLSKGLHSKRRAQELKESTKKDGQWYGSVFISDEEMEESARNVMRRMRGEY